MLKQELYNTRPGNSVYRASATLKPQHSISAHFDRVLIDQDLFLPGGCHLDPVMVVKAC